MGKQKGSFHALYERGWIDLLLDPKEYTMQGPLDLYGNCCLEKSIKSLISLQPDFLNEETLLQTYYKKLGVLSDRTTVAHCEVAGKGIELNWGFSKIVYRLKPLEDKRNKNIFQGLVRSVLAKDILTLSVCCSNVHRARQYMLAYVAIEEHKKYQSIVNSQQPNNAQYNIKVEGKPTLSQHDNTNITHALIENCFDLFCKQRSH